VTQYFAFRQFKLWRAPLHTRVLLTLFNLMMVASTAISIFLYRIRTGMTPSGARIHYLGNEGEALGGAGGGELHFARTLDEMLDVTHPHAFSQSFLFFILCHIFALTGVSSRIKIAVYVASFGSVALDLAVPYLIRYVSPAFAPLQIVNGALMTITLAVLIGVPLYEMWIKREPDISRIGP
jgi:hypothetical protein